MSRRTGTSPRSNDHVRAHDVWETRLVPASRRCLIVANGAIPGIRLLRRLQRVADVVIATDGAARLLVHGLVPDYVVGDFDSVEPEILDQFPARCRIHLPDQNMCDLEKALQYAGELGCTDATLVGALGYRLDHALTTISVMLKYADQFRLRHVDAKSELIAVTDQAELTGSPGDTLSLVVMAPVHGVTLTGVRWPLEARDLEPGSLGVSNVFVDATVRIRVRGGCLLVCHLRHPRRRQRLES